jgi:DNA-binding transcriptional LysR family regulator
MAMRDLDRVLRSNLKLKHLQLLVALEEFRHLGRAAEFLALTQPAVSKSLAEIERLFGLDLFVRSTRGTEPTAYGATVARFARSVLADFGRTREELAAAASGAAGRVAVGAMVVATPALVADAVDRFKARAPKAALSVEEGDLSRLLPRLRVGELDLIAGRLEPGYAAPDLYAEPLYAEPMCLVAARESALARTASPRWEELAAQPWVVPPAWAASRVKLNQAFYRRGLQPPADLIETASYLMTVTFLRRRKAIGFVARGVGRHLEREGIARVLPLELRLELPPVGLLTMRSRRHTPAAEQFLECVRESARKQGARV